MDISKHQILRNIYNVTQKVEELGASEELTAIVCDLGDIATQAEELVDFREKANRVMMGHQI